VKLYDRAERVRWLLDDLHSGRTRFRRRHVEALADDPAAFVLGLIGWALRAAVYRWAP
jgi:hypothetical protein